MLSAPEGLIFGDRNNNTTILDLEEEHISNVLHSLDDCFACVRECSLIAVNNLVCGQLVHPVSSLSAPRRKTVYGIACPFVH